MLAINGGSSYAARGCEVVMNEWGLRRKMSVLYTINVGARAVSAHL